MARYVFNVPREVGYHAEANAFHSDLHASYAESRSLGVTTLPRFAVAASIAVRQISAYNYHSAPMTGMKVYQKSGMTDANLCQHSLENSPL
jgi:hypothetical protein